MKKITNSILLIALALNMTSCATIFGGRVTESQRTKPQAGEPSRKIRTFALLGDIFFWGGAGLIVDFATNAIYKPTDKGEKASNKGESKKSDKKNEGSTSKSSSKKSGKGGEKVTLEDYLEDAFAETGITPFDNFNKASFVLAGSVKNLKEEARFLIITNHPTTNKETGLLQDEIRCFTKDTLPELELKGCKLTIPKQDAIAKFVSIGGSLLASAASVQALINQATSLPSELTALAKSNPSLAFQVPKAIKKLGETVKLLKIALNETKGIGLSIKETQGYLATLKAGI
jgi:hypothetical protein